jgi:hypothetical protein
MLFTCVKVPRPGRIYRILQSVYEHSNMQGIIRNRIEIVKAAGYGYNKKGTDIEI